MDANHRNRRNRRVLHPTLDPIIIPPSIVPSSERKIILGCLIATLFLLAFLQLCTDTFAQGVSKNYQVSITDTTGNVVGKVDIPCIHAGRDGFYRYSGEEKHRKFCTDHFNSDDPMVKSEEAAQKVYLKSRPLVAVDYCLTSASAILQLMAVYHTWQQPTRVVSLLALYPIGIAWRVAMIDTEAIVEWRKEVDMAYKAAGRPRLPEYEGVQDVDDEWSLRTLLPYVTAFDGFVELARPINHLSGCIGLQGALENNEAIIRFYCLLAFLQLLTYSIMFIRFMPEFGQMIRQIVASLPSLRQALQKMKPFMLQEISPVTMTSLIEVPFSAASRSNEEEHTLFLHSCLYGKKQQLRILIDEGNFDVNKVCPVTGFNGLHLACLNQRSIVQLLIDRCKKSLDVNCPSKNGRAPIIIAAEKGFDKIARELLNAKKIKLESGIGEMAALAAVKNDHFQVAHMISCKMQDSKVNFTHENFPSYINRLQMLYKQLQRANGFTDTKIARARIIVSTYKNILGTDKVTVNTHGLEELELECPICMDPFDGHILRCSQDHWFCNSCIQHLKKEEEDPYLCPMCRDDFTVNPPVRCSKAEKILHLMQSAEERGESVKDLMEKLQCHFCSSFLGGANRILRCSEHDHWFCEGCSFGPERCGKDLDYKRCWTLEKVVEIVQKRLVRSKLTAKA